jgi:hypothetical protein
LIPPRCPDCGHGKVREANSNEIKEYHRLQKILADEIIFGILTGLSLLYARQWQQ